MTMIDLTDKAALEVKRLIEKEGKPTLGLRLGVGGGGCSGLSYTLNLDDTAGVTDFDKVLEVKGVKVIVDQKSLLYLSGMVLDYEGNLMGGGFKFNNPNAKRSCGCGSSFST